MKSPFFFRLFSVSPFKKVYAHAEKVGEAMALLTDLLCNKCDQPSLAALHQSISECESSADALKYDMRAMLHGSVFMPVSRPIFLEMLDTQDRVINTMKDISGLILSRSMVIPESFGAVVSDICAASSEGCRLLRKMQGVLPILQESGFKGPVVEKVHLWQISIDELESQVDMWHFMLRTELHSVEADMSAVDVMFLYKTFALLASITDELQRSANKYMLMVAK